MMKKARRGFTLLELLMVVIILAILASVALPQYIRATEKARAAEALNFLGAIRQAEMRYRAQSLTGVYTGSIIATNPTTGAGTDLDTVFANIPGLSTTRPLQNWGTVTVQGAGTATGSISVARVGGTYANQTVGIRLGSGTLCGTFAPLFTTTVACTPD